MKKIYIAFSYTALTVLRSPTPYNWRTPNMPPGFSKIVNMITLDIKATAKDIEN